MKTPEPSVTSASSADIAHWDQVADDYATRVGGDADRIYLMLEDELWRALGNVRGLDVLDLGCGHGWLSGLLAQGGAHVRGIDGSEALLKHAQERYPRIEFQRHDLVTAELPEDRTYDRVVAHMVLMDLPDIRPALSHVRRVVRPDGRFVVTLPHPCFFNYPTRRDPDSGELFCGISDYLDSAEWWITSYGGHRHYHRSLSHYVERFREAGFAVWRLFEAPQIARSSDDAAFYRGISKFMLIEARPV